MQTFGTCHWTVAVLWPGFAIIDSKTRSQDSHSPWPDPYVYVSLAKFNKTRVTKGQDSVSMCRFQAPCEAEAQCAALVKAGKVYATGTEDMDALTFGSNILLRHLTFSEARKMPIKEFYLDRVLNELGLSQEEVLTHWPLGCLNGILDKSFSSSFC